MTHRRSLLCHPRARRPLLLMLAGLLTACGISQEVYDKDVGLWRGKYRAADSQVNILKAARAELEAERSQIQQELAKVQQDLSRSESDKSRCLAELSSATAKQGEMAGSLKDALAQLEQMRLRAERQRAVLNGLVQSLQSMASAGKVRVVRRNGRLVVQIAENILFDSGKSRLKAGGREALAELAPLLASVEREFQVTGHTDNVGSANMNWRLSVDRAFSVLEELIGAGYPPERLSAAGYAWFQPVATNDTPEGRQLNRRVDLVLVPNLDELKLPSQASACGRLIARWSSRPPR